MNKPLISVIVPVYNSEKYLDKCISSINAQTYSNLEIILINDGSVDSSADIINRWSEKDSRIKAIHKDNEGDVATRNMGLDVFSGEYVIMIDNDDYIDSDMIEYLYKLLSENNADISRCGYYYTHEGENDEDNSSYSEKTIILGEDDYKLKILDLLESDYNSGVVWNKLYSKKVISSHRMNKADGAADDFLFNYRILCDNPSLVITTVPKYHYLVRDDSMTGKVFTEGAFDIIKAKKLIINDFNSDDEVYPRAVRSYILSAFIVLTGCIKNNYYNESYRGLLESFKTYYSDIKSSSIYSKSEKVKAFAVCKIYPIYRFMIKRKYKNI